jgi:2-polyprenyl-3-methyl-5-hydroxy-6-metoxy-1,4-benzoquinol methylase
MGASPLKTSMEHLNRVAAEYHTNESIPDIHIENLCQEYFIQWLIQEVPADARVLELGYGDGLVTAALAKAGCTLTLVEGAKTLVDRARMKHPEIECVHSLFEEFHAPQSYDLVLASHVLEHVDDPQAILRLMSSWLNETGRIIAVVPNRNSLHRQLAVVMGLQPALDSLSKRDHLVGHQRVYSLQTLEEDILSAGLSVIDSCGFFLKVLPNSMMLDYSRELLWGLNAISAHLPKDLLANIAVIVAKNTSA